jgi:hypothetical protein
MVIIPLAGSKKIYGNNLTTFFTGIRKSSIIIYSKVSTKPDQSSHTVSISTKLINQHLEIVSFISYQLTNRQKTRKASFPALSGCRE